MNKLIPILLIILSLFGCSKSSDSSSTTLMPLAIGYRWHFNLYTYTDSASTVYTTTIISWSVTDTIPYNGKIYYGISGNNNAAYRNVDNNTVEEYDGVNTPSVAFKRVAKDGDIVNGSWYGIKTPEIVNNLTCLRNTKVIVSGQIRDSINCFLCPGVGMVRNEHWYKNAINAKGYYLLTRQDLTSYNFSVN